MMRVADWSRRIQRVNFVPPMAGAEGGPMRAAYVHAGDTNSTSRIRPVLCLGATVPDATSTRAASRGM